MSRQMWENFVHGLGYSCRVTENQYPSVEDGCPAELLTTLLIRWYIRTYRYRTASIVKTLAWWSKELADT